ncbi:MAG: HAD-IA family hydrolase, partial [Ferrovibrio sp.]
MPTGHGPSMTASPDRARQVAEVIGLFEVVVESSKAGLRKPEPAFYERACSLLGIRPDEAVFLDDLGINLKPAAAMGLTTIKVADPDAALAELGRILGMEL